MHEFLDWAGRNITNVMLKLQSTTVFLVLASSRAKRSNLKEDEP